ncbi:ABC transporter permease [Vallitaleaceae bacterium 9-2]
MPVFKLCMRIIKHNLPALGIYLIIFLGISAIFATNMSKEEDPAFSQSKIPMTIISEEDSPLIQGLTEHLSHVAEFVDIDDETEAIQDALYFREVIYILRIPSDFTQNFMQGNFQTMEKTVIEDATNAYYIDLAIEQYLNTARLYVGVEDIDESLLVNKVLDDLSEEIEVKVTTQISNQSTRNFTIQYFNYLAYGLFSILILGVAFTMFILHDTDIKNRNASSPIPIGRIVREHILANIVFAFVVYAFFLLALFVLGVRELSVMMLLFMLNAFVFTLCALGISFVIGSLVKSKAAIHAVANVIALGLSFLSGVFVPQFLLSDSLLKVASFSPVFWYVRANETIGQMSNITADQLVIPLQSMGIQLVFAMTFLSIALVIGKRKWGLERA